MLSPPVYPVSNTTFFFVLSFPGLAQSIAASSLQFYTQPSVDGDSKEDGGTHSHTSSPLPAGDTAEVKLEKSNIILLGPTGCGELVCLYVRM